MDYKASSRTTRARREKLCLEKQTNKQKDVKKKALVLGTEVRAMCHRVTALCKWIIWSSSLTRVKHNIRWYTPFITVLDWERQEGQEFKFILSYIENLRLT